MPPMHPALPEQILVILELLPLVILKQPLVILKLLPLVILEMLPLVIPEQPLVILNEVKNLRPI